MRHSPWRHLCLCALSVSSNECECECQCDCEHEYPEQRSKNGNDDFSTLTVARRPQPRAVELRVTVHLNKPSTTCRSIFAHTHLLRQPGLRLDLYIYKSTFINIHIYIVSAHIKLKTIVSRGRADREQDETRQDKTRHSQTMQVNSSQGSALCSADKAEIVAPT